MSEIVDLDALMPQAAQIKIGGQVIDVAPPKTKHVMRLGFLGQKLADGENLSEAEIEKLTDELNAVVKTCVPQLADTELSLGQLLALVEMLNAMAMPPEDAELKKRGVTTDSPKA